MPNLILVRNDYPDEGALRRVIDYVLRTSICGGYAIDPNYAFEQMRLVKAVFYKSSGVQLKHFVISFTAGEMYGLDFNDLLLLGFQIGKFLNEYQLVYGIHLDTNHTHIHFVMNTVSFMDGHKYSDGLLPFRRLCTWLQGAFPKARVRLCCTDQYFAFHPYIKK